MRYKLYTIFDKVAKEGSPPFTAKNEGMAIRAYHQSIPKDMQKDYELHEVGMWDPETMELEAIKSNIINIEIV